MQDEDNDPMSEAFSLGADNDEDSDEEEEEDLTDMLLEELLDIYDQHELEEHTNPLPPERLEELLEEICDRYLLENNYEQLFKWRLKAAEKGFTTAQADVAELYELGRGVECNLEKAIYWLTKAAEGNCSDSQILLGWFYEEGKGMDKPDHVMAYNWYKKAADLLNVDAFHRCGSSLLERDDFQGALNWFIKGVQCNDGISMNDIGNMFRNGKGVPRDSTKAFEWYERSAATGARSGLLNVAMAYNCGFGVRVDYEKAKSFYKLAAEKGSPTAMNNLADMYLKGEGMEQNFEKALYWVQKSIELGSKDGIATYGEMLFAGNGVEQDYNKAFEHFKISSDSGECNFSHFQLGRMYENGWGCEKDISKAYFLYLKGAKVRDQAALDRLELPFIDALFKKSFHLCDVVIVCISGNEF